MHEPKRTVIEALVVVVVGVVIALSANAMNASGLKLGRNYFKLGETPVAGSRPSNAGPGQSEPTRVADPATQAAPLKVASQAAVDPMEGLAQEVKDKLKHFGLQPIRLPQVKELFQNPLYASDVYVIIDAREDKDYAEGHIPGAHHLYYYQFENYVAEVLPFAQAAEKVVVYCNGGNCEDSVLTGTELRDSKYMVDPSRVFVFPEGFEAWKTAGLPIERGVRNSGEIITGTAATGAAK